MTFISKMQIVIIVLTYEGSDIEEWDGFATLGAKNIRHIKFFGRAARMEPQCASRFAVSDGILPIWDFMCNDQFDSDTRFIFMEEDWRPYNLDKVTDPMDPQACINYIVHLAMRAADANMGDFVWVTYELHNPKKRRPEYGNNCQVYSVPFAKRLRDHTTIHNPTGQHWDVYLLKFLQHGKGSSTRTCFCRPSVGGYFSHKSGCEDRLKRNERKCDWDAVWRTPMTEAFAKSEVELNNHTMFFYFCLYAFCNLPCSQAS